MAFSIPTLAHQECSWQHKLFLCIHGPWSCSLPVISVSTTWPNTLPRCTAATCLGGMDTAIKDCERQFGYTGTSCRVLLHRACFGHATLQLSQKFASSCWLLLPERFRPSIHCTISSDRVWTLDSAIKGPVALVPEFEAHVKLHQPIAGNTHFKFHPHFEF